MYKLILGDCLDKMQGIEDNSIDLIITDLPYGATKNKWDKIINPEKLAENYKRIIKDRGTILLFANAKFGNILINSMNDIFRYELIYEKTIAGGFLNARKIPLTAHEKILVFYKKLSTYNPQMQEGKKYTKNQATNGDGGNYGKFERAGTKIVNEGLRFPRSVLKFSNNNLNSKHKTQKPSKLLEYLIKTYSNEGDLILDSCFGSCGAGLEAVKLKRNFIGIEQDEIFYNQGLKEMQELKI